MAIKIKRLWGVWSGHIITTLTVFSVGCAGYMLGSAQNALANRIPMQIIMGQGVNTTLCDAQCHDLGTDVSPSDLGQGQDSTASDFGILPTDGECVFVGSKSGTKYYPPSCTAVKRIKPENLRCFSSAKDAHVQGYAKNKVCR